MIKIIKQINQLCITATFSIIVVACGATNPPTISEGHIGSTSDETAADKASIPQPVTQVPALPHPGKREKLEYSPKIDLEKINFGKIEPFNPQEFLPEGGENKY